MTSYIFISFLAAPLITYPELPKNNYTIKIPTRLSDKATFSLKYFSGVNTSDVRVYKVVNGVMRVNQSVEVSFSDVLVTLQVFSHNVTTNGTKADVSILINTTNDLTRYAVVVSNTVGETAVPVEVVPKGRSNSYFFKVCLLP